MVERQLELVAPSRASLHIYTENDFTNEDVFDFFAEHQYEYEAGEDGIRTAFKEEADGDTLVYHAEITPEENYIHIYTHDRMNAPYLSTFATKFAPELLDTETAKSSTAYTLGYVHPAVDLGMIQDLLPDIELIGTDDSEELDRLRYSHDGNRFEIYRDHEVIPEDSGAEDFLEFVADLNDRLNDRLPESPTEVDVDELPEGWFAPIVARYPMISDIADEVDIMQPKPVAELVDVKERGIPPNDLAAIGIETVGSALFALDSLGEDERSEFYTAHDGEESFFGDLISNAEGESTSLHEFRSQPLWTPEVEEEVYAQRERYLDLKAIALGYDNFDLEPGQRWIVTVADGEATVELDTMGQIANEQFPHLPVWFATVETIDGSADLGEGDTIVVRGEHLVEQLDTEKDDETDT